MGFASAWLEENTLFPQFIDEAPDSDTGIIVVIPAYNEPGITNVLNSLARCRKPECRVEVMIVVNAPSDSPEELLRNNKKTISEIESWKKENSNSFFRLFHFTAGGIKGWGVGLARKTGMDEAIRRFDFLDNQNGVILCLDADCRVAENYLEAVCNNFLKRKEKNACSIYFEHPLEGDEFPQEIYDSIILYELHLRYYIRALMLAGYPDVFHTIGSAMAVKARPYIKSGGMNRKQAGEDFYFIQKLIPLGGYFNLNSTTVFPSPRISIRVPFGTGASIQKMTGQSESVFHTYDLRAFIDLKLLFERLNLFYSNLEDIPEQYASLPESVRLFISIEEWLSKITEITNNTASFDSFRKRFFSWFNMFRIVKFLNSVHQGYYEKKAVTGCAAGLLEYTGRETKCTTPTDLLLFYRSLDRGDII
jgi:glycosyltransferase involved in cell wall biosynthesis